MRTLVADVLVDWKALFKVVYASAGIGVGVTAAASVAIVGATRFADLRRDGRLVTAGAFAVLGVAGAVLVAAAVVYGLLVMTKKK